MRVMGIAGVESPTKRYRPGVTPRKKHALRTRKARPAPTPALSIRMSAATWMMAECTSIRGFEYRRRGYSCCD